MNVRIKAYITTFVIAVIMYFSVILMLWFVFDITNLTIAIIISSGLTAFFSPQQQIIQKQSGNELVLKWRFSKKGYLYKSKL